MPAPFQINKTMGLVITDSPDIAFLDFNILYDISVGIPSITLTNKSISATSPPDGLANCTWWYLINTPSGVSIHAGSQATPDVTLSDWTTLTIPSGAWPTPFGTPPYGQVEFSSAVPYTAQLYVIDSDGHIYRVTKQVTICRPNGNTSATLGSFGQATVILLTKCEVAKIYGTDTTNYTYQSILGTSQTSTWTLRYPMDANGNMPDPAVVTNKPSVIFPIGYNAQGYQLYMNTFSTYDMGDGQSIKVQYKFLATFAVLCNLNLCEVQCEIDKLAALLPAKCGTVENLEVKDQYQRLVGLQAKCLTGIQQPLCGIDVPATINEMKRILGRDFDCGCSIGSGINPVGNTSGSIILGLDLTGNISGEITNDGDNYIIHLQLPGGSGIPPLQDVATQGNTSTLPLIVGDPAAANNKMDVSRQIITSATEIYAGWGRLNNGDTFGTFWMHKIGAGTVYLRPADASNTYVLIMPANQGTSNTFLKNDGSGNLSWAAAGSTPPLQSVVAAGNSTTNPMLVGDITAAYALLQGDLIALYNAGVQRIALFINSTIPTLRIGGATSGYANIVASAATSTYQLVLPAAQGAAGTFLKNDGSGNLNWGNDLGDFIQLTGPVTYSLVAATKTTILCDTSSGDVTITIGTGNINQQIFIKNTGFAANKVVINISGGGNIDTSRFSFSTTYNLTVFQESVLLTRIASDNSCRRIAPNIRATTGGFNNTTFTGTIIAIPHDLGVVPNVYPITPVTPGAGTVLAGGYSIAPGPTSIVITLNVAVGSPTNVIITAYFALI